MLVLTSRLIVSNRGIQNVNCCEQANARFQAELVRTRICNFSTIERVVASQLYAEEIYREFSPFQVVIHHVQGVPGGAISGE